MSCPANVRWCKRIEAETAAKHFFEQFIYENQNLCYSVLVEEEKSAVAP
jgi:hypothetical protein